MWSHPAPFTIVLCTYNGEIFLEEQLQSLREQDGVAEIIAADDGSSDRTLEILDHHARDDSRLRVIRNRCRLGVVANFENAMLQATSPWIALADQDDIWLPGKLARVHARWNGRADLIHHSSRKFRGPLAPRVFEHWSREYRKFSGSDWRRLLYRNSVVGHTVVFRAALLRKIAPFPQTVPHDWWLGLGIAVHGEAQFINECLVHYRIHETNAYHAAGSRVRRLQVEHSQRLALLRALLRRGWLTGEQSAFAENYLALLERSTAGKFAWDLHRFYRRYSRLFFGGLQRELPGPTCFRKSVAAALAAMVQAPQVMENVGAPGQESFSG